MDQAQAQHALNIARVTESKQAELKGLEKDIESTLQQTVKQSEALQEQNNYLREKLPELQSLRDQFAGIFGDIDSQEMVSQVRQIFDQHDSLKEYYE